MELFDFYKLLQIPVGTPFEDVKKAYILKIHQLSGAYKDGDEKAAEYIQVITEGYQLLGDPERKRIYDLMLLRHYLKQKNSDLQKSMYRKFGTSERNTIADEAEDDDLQESNDKNSPEFTEKDIQEARKGILGEKIQLLVGVFMVGILAIIFNWVYWKPYTDLTMVSYVMLTIAYVVIMLWTLTKLYRYFEIRNIVLQKKMSTEKWVLVVFLIMFFAIPAIAMRLESFRKNYHLKNYAATVRATDFMLEDTWLTVDYTVGNKNYKQSISLGENAEKFKKFYYDKSKFLIVYSTKNPLIIGLETGK